MSKEEEIKRLAEIFRKAGARDPEGSARSQVEDGIYQLARFLFLRRAWQYVVSDDNPAWIDRWIAYAQRRFGEPYSGSGPALESLRRKGATDEELTAIVRDAQAELLFGVCFAVNDGAGDVPEGVPRLAWGLFEVDETGNPGKCINGLHESVLDTDPAGREMRPRGSKG